MGIRGGKYAEKLLGEVEDLGGGKEVAGEGALAARTRGHRSGSRRSVANHGVPVFRA